MAEPKQARLHSNADCHASWCGRVEDWLQIDLGGEYSVSAILTQGAKDDYGFVKMYTLSYKTSGDIWEDYYENGIIKVSFNNYPFMSRIERKYCLTLFRGGSTQTT